MASEQVETLQNDLRACKRALQVALEEAEKGTREMRKNEEAHARANADAEKVSMQFSMLQKQFDEVNSQQRAVVAEMAAKDLAIQTAESQAQALVEKLENQRNHVSQT